MASFGENLRRERELRGITLAELANASKIPQRYLEALERNRFDLLPGGVFNRGFVRAVARYMKLDERHWVGEFVRAAHEEPEVVARYALVPPRPATPAHRGLWSFLLLAGVFAGSAYVIHDLRLRRAAEAASAPVSHQASPANAGDTRIPAAIPAPAAAVSESAPRPVATRLREGGVLRLQVDALEVAWVRLSLDGRTDYEGTMKAGETRSFRAGERIELSTGNASAVVLTLNGETLAPLGNPGEHKTIVLTARDLSSGR